MRNKREEEKEKQKGKRWDGSGGRRDEEQKRTLN